MYGEQPVKSSEEGKKISVIEMFGPTIQGEGPLAGSKTMFIRFGGCDYRCTKCDSLHAVIPQAVQKHSSRMTAQEIADNIIKMAAPSNTPWVTLSGGNPLMWDLSELVDLLQAAGLLIAVETQGTLWHDWLRKIDCLVLSPKAPGMGEKFEPEKFLNILEKIEMGSPNSNIPVALKVVVFSQQDIDFALDIAEFTAAHEYPFRDGLKYFSLGNFFPPKLNESFDLVDHPFGTDKGETQLELLMHDYRILLEDMCNDPRITDWRFLPQIHVLAFGNEAGR